MVEAFYVIYTMGLICALFKLYCCRLPLPQVEPTAFHASIIVSEIT